MNKEIIKKEVLDSLARIGKQWDLEESAIRVWGCMLLKSRKAMRDRGRHRVQ